MPPKSCWRRGDNSLASSLTPKVHLLSLFCCGHKFGPASRPIKGWLRKSWVQVKWSSDFEAHSIDLRQRGHWHSLPGLVRWIASEPERIFTSILAALSNQGYDRSKLNSRRRLHSEGFRLVAPQMGPKSVSNCWAPTVVILVVLARSQTA